ncbi:MAG: oligosaccharide flippase family protein [Candidatus Eisenbacteria bacterium]|nr:oligosaccharide flippase family protein [Candidatus Eisenbacteria bacterium]
MTERDSLSLASILRGQTAARVGRVFGIVLAAAALQVVSQAVLARTLPKSEVGIVSLLIGALPLLSTLSLLGQDSSSVRFLTREDASLHDARRHFRDVLLIVVPLGALLALAGARFYSLAGLAILAAVVLVVSQNATALTTSALRAKHRYELAMSGTRLPVIATGVALLALGLTGRMSLRAALWTMILAYGATAVVLTLHAARTLHGGEKRVPRSVLREGLFFLGLSVSLSVMMAMDKMLIGKLLPMSDLAVYATIFSVMKGFDFLFYSFSYVLLPRVALFERVPLRKLNLAIAGVAIVVTGLYLGLGRRVVNVLFSGEYDAGSYLILPFALSGVLKLFYSVPSSVIGGRLRRSALREFLWFNLGGIALNVALDILLILRMGLLGAAIATAIAWAVRLAGGYMVMSRHGQRPESHSRTIKEDV